MSALQMPKNMIVIVCRVDENLLQKVSGIGDTIPALLQEMNHVKQCGISVNAVQGKDFIMGEVLDVMDIRRELQDGQFKAVQKNIQIVMSQVDVVPIRKAMHEAGRRQLFAQICLLDKKGVLL